MTADRELAQPAPAQAIVDHPGTDDVVQFNRGLYAPWDYGPGLLPPTHSTIGGVWRRGDYRGAL